MTWSFPRIRFMTFSAATPPNYTTDTSHVESNKQNLYLFAVVEAGSVRIELVGGSSLTLENGVLSLLNMEGEILAQADGQTPTVGSEPPSGGKSQSRFISHHLEPDVYVVSVASESPGQGNYNLTIQGKTDRHPYEGGAILGPVGSIPT